MKKELINLIRKGKLQNALEKGAQFLKTMNDNYYAWTTLQSRFNDKKNENIKGILDGEEYTKQLNKINSQLLDLILKIDDDLTVNNTKSKEEQSIKDRLQNALLGTYEVLDVLSEGSLTVTFRAKELFDNDFVAIKVLKFDNFMSSEEAFEQINAVKTFNHRNIVSIYGRSGANTKPKYVILEYIDGIPLKNIILENGARPEGESKRLLLKLCEALYYLHKRKIFNSDLRADRIFIDNEGEPIFAPFILFRSRTDCNYDQIVANLKYMSFQRLNAKDYTHFDPRSNQFSLGVLAYLLIVGEPLFNQNSIVDLIEARNLFENDDSYRAQKLSKLDCSDDLKNLVTRLLSKDVKNRFSSMFEIITTLKNMKNYSSEYNIIAQESYSRACSYNPKITFNLVKEINDKDIENFPDLDLNEFAIKLHNIINLIIETDSNKSYLMKAIKSKELSLIFTKYDKEFKEILYHSLDNSDYLWSQKIKDSWDITLDETFGELKKSLSNKKLEKIKDNGSNKE